jgi:UDP-glucose 4-epimerase
MSGNLAMLARWARSPYPLPLGGLMGRRTLLSVDNLADAIETVIAAPAPLRRPFIVADAEPLTVPDMIAAMRQGLGRRPGLLPIPEWLLSMALRVSGRSDWYPRLAGSQIVDTSALRGLGWVPRVQTKAGLAALMRDPI